MLLTWDLGGYRWDGESRTWGLAVRGAVDDLGFRFGPKAFLRLPLRSSGSSFFQLGVTFYLFSGDGDLKDLPGWCGELEIAPSDKISLALGVESLKYGVYNYDYENDFPYWTDESNASLYAGVKMGSWIGIVATTILFGVAAAASGGG